MTNEQVMETVKGMFANKFPKHATGRDLTWQEFFDGHMVCEHWFNGTPEKIQVGMVAPDGKCFTPDGDESTLHSEIRANWDVAS